MKALLAAVLLALPAWAAEVPTPETPQEVKPPFGLTWGETAERIEKLLEGVKAKIVSRTRKDGDEVFEVEGLVQTGLKRTLFVFRDARLQAVTLEYQRPEWEDR